MKQKLIIFGSGEIAQLAHFYFDSDSDYEVVAFAVDAADLSVPILFGLPLVAFEDVTRLYPPDTHDFFVAIGYSKQNAVRKEKYLAVKALGYRLASFISSRATVLNDGRIGENCFILEHNIVQPFVTIGNNVTLWSGNHIGHHALIGDFAFISSHVVISGGVKVGERSFLGVNSTTNDHISIGARCVIGSGALIVKDVPDEGVLSAEAAKLSPVPSRRLKGF